MEKSEFVSSTVSASLELTHESVHAPYDGIQSAAVDADSDDSDDNDVLL